MKKTLLIITAGVTAIATVTSLFLSAFANPTTIQQVFFITSSAIAIAGGLSIFLLLEKDQDDRSTP